MSAHSRSVAAAILAAVLAVATKAQSQSPFYTDSGSPANPPWSTILPTLNDGTGDPGPVFGSAIDVNNALTETGLYGGRPISVGSYRIHVCCNTSTTNFTNFTRWFQIDGNTQVLRLFVNDENTATARDGTSRTEAFNTTLWTEADNMTHEWTGRYTVARRQQGYAIFQVKNPDHDWGVQLNLLGSGELVVNNRRNAPDVTVTNPDGSIKDFDGVGFDARIQDDGRNYKVWIDGVLLADNYFDRPTAGSNFRWGMYLGSNVLTPPSDNTVILVSGAQVRSWPGALTAPTTSVLKANNTQALANTASWSGGVLPGLHNQALWDSTVTAANTTTLNADQTWGGLRITNPGGAVTINGTALLGLDESGVDMSSATRNLTLTCPVELRVSQTWNVAPAISATANGPVRGYGGLTVSGGGTLTLTGANSFTGPVNITAGALRITDSNALGSAAKSVRTNTASTASRQLLLDGSSAAINLPSTISFLTGNDVNGSIINEAGSNTIAGAITLTGLGTNTRIYSNAGSLTLSGPIDSSFINRTLRLMGAADGSVTGPIINGHAALVVSVSKEESGTWTLGGDNTYGGTTSVLAGTLVIAHPDALGTGGMTPGNTTSGTTLTAGAVLNLNGQQGINEVITLRGSGTSGEGAMINTGPTSASIAGGRVASISTTAGGTHSTVPVVTLSGGGGSGATAVATLGLRAASFTINGGTTVYSTAPSVSISGGGGRSATATAVLTGGVVTGIVINFAGAGYTSAPSITFSGGTVVTPGINPTGTGNDSNFLVAGVQVTNPGSGYTSAPSVTFGSGTGTTATANLSALLLAANTSIGGSGDTLIQCGISGAFALTKSGSGRVTLGGPCTHTGGTVVASGTLALGASNVMPSNTVTIDAATLDASSFADATGTLDVTAAAAIRLGSGATLSFADSSAVDWTGGTLSITGSFVPGASLRFGTSLSGLTSAQLARISAPGFTSFAVDANGYLAATVAATFSQWQSSNGGGGPFTGDHDQDGVPNGIEYFLGGSTNTSGPTALPSVAQAAGVRSVTWTKSSAYPGTYGVDFWVETSTTLTGVWSPETLGVTVTASGNSVTYTFPAGGPRRFARLKVLQP